MRLFKYAETNLFYFSLVTFVFVSSFAMSLVVPEPIVVTRKQAQVSPLPVLSNIDFFPILSAQGAIAVDTISGVVLYEKNPDLPLLPASTTKIMTALVAMDHYSKSEVIKIGNLSVEGQKMGLFNGEEMTFEDLLYGLLVYSANDAAEALAQNYCAPRSSESEVGPCGRAAFIDQMNVKAQTLNLQNTRFSNPTGLDGEGHASTARDMARLSVIAMGDPYFAKIVATEDKIVTNIEQTSSYYLSTTNKLLGEVEGVLGVKTGWTQEARENLITFVERDGKKILVAVLGSQDRFGETEELIEWIFDSYNWTRVSYHRDLE